ncbi:MAG: HD domain-containing protein [Ktedonobacteraceae bacterium]
MNAIHALLHALAYRLGQAWQQLGFVAPLSTEDKQEIQHWLPTSALSLFYTMSNADQQHSLRVCRGIQAQGCAERDMLAAALLHDVGKAHGRVPFWTRPVIVLGKLCAPRLLAWIVLPLVHMRSVEIDVSVSKWRRALSYAWWHAEVGAELAKDAGLSECAVLYIRTHHEPNGPAAILHHVDEVS